MTKCTYNKAKPDIEYGMLSGRKLNRPLRKAGEDGLVTYFYTSLEEPRGGRYYRQKDYYIIPVKVPPEVYAALVEQDRIEHNNNHKHDRRALDVEQYVRRRGLLSEDDDETNPWGCLADERTYDLESALAEQMDGAALVKHFPKEDKIILKAYEQGISQKIVAKVLGKSQSYVSKELSEVLDRIEHERMNDGALSDIEIEFEIEWKKFLYSHKMPHHIDVIAETFNYLVGERMLEEFLVYFYSFGEYYHYAYKILFLYIAEEEYDDNPDKEWRSIELIKELPPLFQRIFYYQGLDDQADIFIWLYYCLVTEMERRRTITPEPSQASYEKYLAEQEKIAKRVEMTAGQFAEKRFIPKIAPQIKKRNDELLRALGVVVVDENTDIEATVKKYAKKKK